MFASTILLEIIKPGLGRTSRVTPSLSRFSRPSTVDCCSCLPLFNDNNSNDKNKMINNDNSNDVNGNNEVISPDSSNIINSIIAVVIIV